MRKKEKRMANLNQSWHLGSHQNFSKIFTCSMTEIKTYASWLALIEIKCMDSHIAKTVHLQSYTLQNHDWTPLGGLLNMYINLSSRFWKITINYKRIIEFPVDEIGPNPHLSTDLNLLRPIFLTNLCKGNLELSVVFRASLFEAGFCRVETKAGWNMTAPRKCSNQPPTGQGLFKCGLGLKSLSCGSYIKHEPVSPFKRTNRTVFCKTLGGLFASSMCFQLSAARPLGSF